MKTPEQQSSEHWSTVIIPIINVLLLLWKVRIYIRNKRRKTFESLWCTLDWVYTWYYLDISHNSTINVRCKATATFVISNS